MKRTIMTGKTYLHFKGNRYSVLAIARHTETGEEMVVYQSVDDDGQTYVMPMDLFLSEVDRDKYPEATQTFHFEEVEKEGDLLMDFLDAESYSVKISIFKRMMEKMDERLVNNVAASLDVVLEDESLEDRCDSILQYMNTRARFETKRLR